MNRDGLTSVNWKNPMLLGDQHLRMADACSIAARRRLARSLAAHTGGYGLVPATRGGGAAIRVSFEQQVDRLLVQVHELSAMAPDGSLLMADSQAFPEVEEPLSADVALERNPVDPERYSLLVDYGESDGDGPDTWVEVGMPDPAEDPPRRPFRHPKLRVRLVAGGHSQGGTLKIAEYLWDGRQVVESPGYLPPMLVLDALPQAIETALRIRSELTALREHLTHAAAAPPDSLISDILVPWVGALAAVEDRAPLHPGGVAPRQVWEAVIGTGRVSSALLATRPAAIESALRELVQRGDLESGSTDFFAELNEFIDGPYDHERTGALLEDAETILRNLRQVVGFLLGKAPEKPKGPDWSRFFYQDDEYKLAEHELQTIDGVSCAPWAICTISGVTVDAPRRLLLVVDRELLSDGFREGTNVRMIARREETLGLMQSPKVLLDPDSTKAVVLLDRDIPPEVTDVTIASAGQIDLEKLGPEPDGRIRLYYLEKS